MFQISDEWITLIKTTEAFRSQLYNCPAGHATIGFGHLVHRGPVVTGTQAPPGLTPRERRARETALALEAPFVGGLSEGDADRLFRRDLVMYEEAVRRLVRVPLDQYEYDALVDLAYNIGVRAFKGSTLLRKLNAGDYAGASLEFGKWVNANGKRLEGLVRRRAADRALFDRDLPRQPVSA